MFDIKVYVLYTVQYMVQLISISKARSTLSSLITQVAATKEPVIIVRESEPVAIIQPYNAKENNEKQLQELLSLNTDWFTKEYEEDIKAVRKELNKRDARLKW